jgi:uncharacterized protein YdaU (DUF1376 family)
MSKAPAFQFYAQDFLTGVMDLTMEERGLYITLLARQWAVFNANGIPKKRLGLLVGYEWENLPEMVKDKFTDNGDYFFNKRLQETFLNMKSFKEKQRINGLKGGRPKTQTKPKRNPKQSSSLKIEDRSIKIEDRKKKIEVVLPYDSENFQNAWHNWKEYKSIEFGFKYKTEQSEQAALMKLSNETDNEQHAILSINNSMANGWKGIFAHKEDKNGSKTTSKKGNQYSDNFITEVANALQS